mmetsp:Transcript_61014/g.108847  ORF Transcript_61014/g.108847 Transcript_61014/m.108847 type:complete len:299 (+) Transcript_61014:157-1053(+)
MGYMHRWILKQRMIGTLKPAKRGMTTKKRRKMNSGTRNQSQGCRRTTNSMTLPQDHTRRFHRDMKTLIGRTAPVPGPEGGPTSMIWMIMTNGNPGRSRLMRGTVLHRTRTRLQVSMMMIMGCPESPPASTMMITRCSERRQTSMMTITRRPEGPQTSTRMITRRPKSFQPSTVTITRRPESPPASTMTITRCPESTQASMRMTTRCPESPQAGMMTITRRPESPQANMMTTTRCPERLGTTKRGIGDPTAGCMMRMTTMRIPCCVRQRQRGAAAGTKKMRTALCGGFEALMMRIFNYR